MDYSKYMKLRDAVRRGEEFLVRFVIASLNEDEVENLLFYSSVNKDDYDIIRFCLENKAISQSTKDYALAKAALKGCIDTVELFLDYGAKVHGHTLRRAKIKGQTAVVELLLEHMEKDK